MHRMAEKVGSSVSMPRIIAARQQHRINISSDSPLDYMGVRRGGGGGGGSMGSNDPPPPSPMRGHLHHWNFFFISRTSILHICTLSTIALTQYR